MIKILVITDLSPEAALVDTIQISDTYSKIAKEKMPIIGMPYLTTLIGKAKGIPYKDMFFPALDQLQEVYKLKNYIVLGTDYKENLINYNAVVAYRPEINESYNYKDYVDEDFNMSKKEIALFDDADIIFDTIDDLVEFLTFSLDFPEEDVNEIKGDDK